MGPGCTLFPLRLSRPQVMLGGGREGRGSARRTHPLVLLCKFPFCLKEIDFDKQTANYKCTVSSFITHEEERPPAQRALTVERSCRVWEESLSDHMVSNLSVTYLTAGRTGFFF